MRTVFRSMLAGRTVRLAAVPHVRYVLVEVCGQFETADALDAGERVHHELFHPAGLTRGMAQVITK